MQIWARQQEKKNGSSQSCGKTPKTNTPLPRASRFLKKKKKKIHLGRSASEGLAGSAQSQLRLRCHHRGETGSAKAKRRRSTTMITDGDV